jgi:glutathione reductase (NADPH)
MQEYDFDLFTIGGGSGGVRASRMAAGLGARVAVAEERQWGGTCVNLGCIPKKLFTYAAHVPEDMRVAESYGWQREPLRFDWATLLQNKNREILRLNGVYQDLLTKAGCTLLTGRARMVGPHEVEVAGKRYTAKAGRASHTLRHVGQSAE